MFPAYWPSKISTKIKDLWFSSSGFYIRTTPPKNQGDKPAAMIGLLDAFCFDVGGSSNKATTIGANSNVRQHGETSVRNGNLVMTMVTVDSGANLHTQRLEFATNTIPVAKGAKEVTVISGVRNTVSFTSAKASAYDLQLQSVAFVRDGDGVLVANLAFDALSYPAGTRGQTQNTVAATLCANASSGPTAYDRAIATSKRVYGCAVGDGSDPTQWSNIKGFTGIKQGDAQPGGGKVSQDEQPAAIAITGDALEGQCVVSKPVGKLSEDHVIIQQASISTLINPNPASGYTQQNDQNGNPVYTQNGFNADGTINWQPVPFNAYANWQGNDSSRVEYLWSGHVYRVDVTDTANNDGSVKTTAVRSTIGQVLNEWRQKRYTGIDPLTGLQTMAYQRTIDVGTGKPVYTPLNVPVPPQWIPAAKSKINPDGSYDTSGSYAGVFLCAAMTSAKHGVVLQTAAYNAVTPFTYKNNAGATYYVPGGTWEINESLWVGVSRITSGGTGGSDRWIYSRDQGQTWNSIDAKYTNSSLPYTGTQMVNWDLAVTTSAIATALKAAEVALA